MKSIKNVAIVALVLVGTSLSLLGRSQATTGSVSPLKRERKNVPNKDVPNKDVPNKDVPNKDVPNKDVPEQDVRMDERLIPLYNKIAKSLDTLSIARVKIPYLDGKERFDLMKEVIPTSQSLVKDFIDYEKITGQIAEKAKDNARSKAIAEFRILVGQLGLARKSQDMDRVDKAELSFKKFMNENDEILKESAELVRLFKDALQRGLLIHGIDQNSIDNIIEEHLGKYAE